MIVVYSNPNSPCTTVQISQGLDFAGDGTDIFTNFVFDWTSESNPVANPPDVTLEWMVLGLSAILVGGSVRSRRRDVDNDDKFDL